MADLAFTTQATGAVGWIRSGPVVQPLSKEKGGAAAQRDCLVQYHTLSKLKRHYVHGSGYFSFVDTDCANPPDL